VNEEDHQRADDLERALDEGDLARASKMTMKWSTSNAEVAVAEVQRRSDAHRKATLEGVGADAPAPDTTSFDQRDEDLAALRAKLAA